MNGTHASSLEVERLSAAQAVAASIDFAELQLGPAGLFWNEYRPDEAACRIWKWQDGQALRVTPQGFSVRSRVYEYGGGSFCLVEGGVVFVNEADQQLYRQDEGAPAALTQGEYRYGGLAFAAGQVLAVEEQPHPGQDLHRLVAIDPQSGARQVLAEGADFYASPILCGDGTRLAWIEWDRPHQPWTSTRLMCAERRADGGWYKPLCMAGDGLVPESLQQPRFDERSRLHCITDRNGYWQPWRESAEGWLPLPCEAADHAGAPWQLGASTWQPLSNDEFLATWFEEGFARLGIVRHNGRIEDYTAGYSRFRSLAVDADRIYAIAASPEAPSAIIAIDRHTHAVTPLAGGQCPIDAASISRPQPLAFPTGSDFAFGFFYPAQGGDAAPPLVVFIHGGPTSACYPVFEPRIQFWTQRGFAVAEINYRGSTCHGRAFRQALHRRWGEVDVEDACAVVEHLGQRGLVDPKRAFIRGSSAGGYTTLCALAFKDVFRGGASLYGVSDPLALARATHKFEGDYLDWLIGDPDTEQQRYAGRTPLLHAADIKVPVIFFQGELDPVVIPQQTRSMLDALQANGVAAQGHFFADERHGFRKASNLAFALEEEWKFYSAIL